MNRMGRLVLDGWGRQAAWTVLLICLALQVGLPGLFAGPRTTIFDAYQRILPRTTLHKGVVIVAIDGESLSVEGQWPWPHNKTAKLISTILQGNPLALGIDMIWTEPDRQSPEQWLADAGEVPPSLAAAMRQLPSHETLLSQALKSGPVAIGIGGPPPDGKGKPDSGPLVPVLLSDLDAQTGQAQDPPLLLPSFDTTSRSIPELDQAAPGHAFLSVVPDSDGTFRRLPMISRLSGRLAPALGLEVLRLAMASTQSSWPRLYYNHQAIVGVGVGDLRIPTQSDGSVWVNFSTHDPSRFVSATKVLQGKVAPHTFDHKLVLLGLTADGILDRRYTPVDFMPGVEIQAQFLEDILLGQLASRPSWGPVAEWGLTLGIGLLLITCLALLRSLWQLLLICGVFVGLGALGAGVWQHWRILLDVATPAIGVALVAVAYMGAGFAQADKQRRRLRQELEQRKLAAARSEGELEAARRIQMGILPNPAALNSDPRFELDALMIPARQIGGDLFDFFKMDKDRLFISVGDVSGKGVPAALFMALGKSLCKSIALSGQAGIGAILDRANSEISRENPEMLFITLFAGILDLNSGTLDFCSAGHDAPFLLRVGEMPQAIDTKGGPPLCIVEDFSYPAERFALKPGDLLCIITDGITEAMTADGAVMGRAKASDVLAALPPDIPASAVIKALHDAVDAYVAGAEPSDDLTILTVRWHGPIAR